MGEDCGPTSTSNPPISSESFAPLFSSCFLHHLDCFRVVSARGTILSSLPASLPQTYWTLSLYSPLPWRSVVYPLSPRARVITDLILPCLTSSVLEGSGCVYAACSGAGSEIGDSNSGCGSCAEIQVVWGRRGCMC